VNVSDRPPTTGGIASVVWGFPKDSRTGGKRANALEYSPSSKGGGEDPFAG